MRFLTLATTLVLVAVTLAGCAEETTAPEDDDAFQDLEVSATEDTGLIRGIVVDPTIVPVADVTVRIQGAGLETTTNADGAFVFADLEPGTYFLEVEKLGYQSLQSSAEVVAGVDKPPIVKIQLVPDPSSLPYLTALQFDGFIACSTRLGLIGLALCAQFGVTDDDFSTSYTLDAVPGWIQSEAVWESTQTLGSEMSLSLTCLDGHTGCPDGQYDYAQSEGESPRIAMVPADVAETYALGAGEDLVIRMFAFGNSDTDVYDEEQNNGLYNSTAPQQVQDVAGEGCPMWPTLFDDCIRMTGFGVILEQEFTIYTNVFYGFAPEEGWVFIENGAHPVPES